MLTSFSRLFEYFERAALLLTLTGEVRMMNPAAQTFLVRPRTAGPDTKRDSEPTNAQLSEISILVPQIAARLISEKRLVIEQRFEDLGRLQLSFSLVESDAKSRDERNDESLILLIINHVDKSVAADITGGIKPPVNTGSRVDGTQFALLNNPEVDQFIYNVSHDLKSPLVTMLGFIEVLKEDGYTKLDDQTRKYIDYIIGGAKKLELRLTALLELSRVSRSIKLTDYLGFRELVGEAIQRIKLLPGIPPVEIKVSTELPSVCCDSAQIVEVLTHLITNAVKFTPAGRKPEIEISYQQLTDHYEFCVSDNGIGIDKKFHEKIFELYYRINEIKTVDGVGLGLTLARKVILAHGGDFRVESVVGKGSKIFFTLPITVMA